MSDDLPAAGGADDTDVDDTEVEVEGHFFNEFRVAINNKFPKPDIPFNQLPGGTPPHERDYHSDG